MFFYIKYKMMDYQIKKLEKTDLKRHLETYIQTLQNLSKTPNISPQKANDIFDKIKNQWTIIYIAINETEWVIGSISLLLEKKFLRWGGVAGHIEDVVVRKWFEWHKIWSKLMEIAIKKAKEIWCYKIILDCDQKLEWYYQKFWFQTNWSFMRMYL